MQIENPQTQTVKSTLADLLQSGNDTNLRPYRVLIGHNMGFNTLVMSVPIDKFYDISEVANERNLEEKAAFEGQQVAQRELDPKHAERLATYILKGLFASAEAIAKRRGIHLPEEFEDMQEALGSQPYLALQPITANIRNCDFGGGGLRVEQAPDGAVTVFLAPHHVLWVIDGQHRREAMRILFEFLKDVTTTLKYPRRMLYPGGNAGDPVSQAELQVWNMILESWRSGCTAMVEVHLGLSASQERQLFHDLNNLTKKVAPSLAFSYDNANPINVYIKQNLIEAETALFKDKVVERDNTPWSDDRGVITRKDLVAINSILFLNKGNARGAVPQVVHDNLEYADRFWRSVGKISGFGSPGAKLQTVAAQPVLLKSIAKLAYTFGLGRSPDHQSLERLMQGIASIDYSHNARMWRFNRLSEEERQEFCPGLGAYLPSGFVEVGSYDEEKQLFRFSALHNDIIPAIGDMIRWSLKLPNRFAARIEEVSAGDDFPDAPLVVEIDFPALGFKQPAQTVAERHASDSMRKVLEALVAAMGPGVLKKLAEIRVNRGPLVSESPDRDYRIAGSEKLYAHQRIGSTGYHVLTNSESPQKVQDLRRVGETLGLSPLHFRVRMTTA